MAQAEARIAITAGGARTRSGKGGRASKALREALIRAYRTSRDREEMARLVTASQAGRETGVKC